MTDEKTTKKTGDDFDLVIPEQGLHRPTKIEVAGKPYYSKKISIKVFKQLKALQEKAEGGDDEAPLKQVEIVFGVPFKVLEDEDMRDLGVVGEILTKMLTESELYRTEKEKKVVGPGKKNSAS